MAKSGTGRTSGKSDSKKVAQKLQELTKKLSDKSIYAVKKHYDVFAVAEIKTNASVIKDLPSYEIADRFTNKLNRGHAKVDHINRRLPELLTEYPRWSTSVMPKSPSFKESPFKWPGGTISNRNFSLEPFDSYSYSRKDVGTIYCELDREKG